MRDRSLFVLTALLIGALILAGCGPKTGTTTPPLPASSPTSAPVATTQPVASNLPASLAASIRLDPAVTDDSDTLLVCSLVYDSLTTLDSAGKPQPALALSWTVSEDQMDYVISLRQGVNFLSGKPFNADSVMANFNRWFDPADALHGQATFPGWEKSFLGYKGDLDSSSKPVSPFDGIEKVDEHTVLIHLNRAMPDLMAILAGPNFGILDPSVLASQGSSYGTSQAGVSGTGAYSVSAWTSSGLDLAPNASYWGQAPAGSVHFDLK